MTFLERWSRPIAGITKSAIGLVKVKEFRLTISAAGWQRVHLRIDVTAHRDEIEPAIVIEVREGRAPLYVRQRRQRDSGLIGDIGETPVTIIAIEIVVFVGEIRRVNRWAPGVIVIADSHAHRALFATIFTHGGTRLQPNLLKFSIA